MIKQCVFVGKQKEVMNLIKNMAEFETLGEFFNFQNEIIQIKSNK